MTTDRIWRFPLVALALSPREVGFVAATGPMRIDAARSWSVRHVPAKKRLQFLETRLLRALQKFVPATILVTDGTHWRITREVQRFYRAAARRLGLRVAFLSVEDACKVTECSRSLKSAAGRIVDSHPELARRLRPALMAKVNAGALRDVRPVLSALTVAHAASVAHLIKLG